MIEVELDVMSEIAARQDFYMYVSCLGEWEDFSGVEVPYIANS